MICFQNNCSTQKSMSGFTVSLLYTANYANDSGVVEKEEFRKNPIYQWVPFIHPFPPCQVSAAAPSKALPKQSFKGRS